MYFDLNIPFDPKNINGLGEILKTAVALGYDTVALNYTSRGKVSGNDAGIVRSVDINEANDSQKSLKQLSRITVHLDDNSQVHVLNPNNPVLATFDIVAVQPNTESLLLKCCQSSEIDIISLDLAQRLSFPLKTSILSQAVDKGIFFELVRATRGRNLIFSSGATSAMLLRGPYDLVNLGSIFGIEGALLKRSLSENPRATILHADTRKTHKAVLQVVPLCSVPESARNRLLPSENQDDSMDVEVSATL